MRTFHAYILASHRRRLYIGVTSALLQRIWKHKHGVLPGFTRRYRIHKLVHFEEFRDAASAIAREKELKSWPRARKIRLIESTNAGWRDLARDWFMEPGPTRPR